MHGGCGRGLWAVAVGSGGGQWAVGLRGLVKGGELVLLGWWALLWVWGMSCVGMRV